MRAALAFLLALASLSPSPALAMAERVDDSRTQVLGALRLKWDAAVPQAGQPETASDQITIRVHLDVAKWTGRSGKIYMKLEPSGGGVQATWTSRGILLPGTVRDGDRTLVYAGMITGQSLEDVIDMTVRTMGGEEAGSRLRFAFEIEMDGP
ncbi:hypothetical protein [Arenimonas sp.]|uniref:hypothetical protein n=1 Tax=Arenimonas sp. TaxID=1872635 RepID=UPI0025F2D18D|nr:hypothetical protein [Arenimonas sp.]